MTISANLLAWRRRAGLTQKALSDKTGIPQPNIAALEAGRLDPKLSTLRRLAGALGVTPGKLIDARPPAEGWNRHRIDALARQATRNDRSRKDRDTKLGRALRVVAAERLEAKGLHVPRNGRTGERLIKQLQADLGPSVWAAVVKRLDKFL